MFGTSAIDYFGALVGNVAEYLWPWNLILVGAYLAFWCGTLVRDLRVLRIFQTLAQVLFVLFGLLVALWPMFAFNLLILITQIHRLLDLGRSTTFTSTNERSTDPSTNGAAPLPVRPPVVMGRLSILVEDQANRLPALGAGGLVDDPVWVGTRLWSGAHAGEPTA